MKIDFNISASGVVTIICLILINVAFSLVMFVLFKKICNDFTSFILASGLAPVLSFLFLKAFVAI